jgi:hypothetical protein
MLKSFLYLNEASLSNYLSELEGGQRETVEHRASKKTSIGGGVDAKILSGKGDRGNEDETTITMSDTAHARFGRFETLVSADAERHGWIDVTNPDADLKDVGIGALISMECEIYVPEMIKALSKSGGLGEAIDMMSAILPSAGLLGLDTSGVPSGEQLTAMRSFVSGLGSDQVVVGEHDDSDWRVAGKALAQYISAGVDLEGYARVVGKVSARWNKGQWKPLLSLPGMNLLPRKERRELEKKGPEPDQADQWLEGPAVMLDLLAVYR